MTVPNFINPKTKHRQTIQRGFDTYRQENERKYLMSNKTSRRDLVILSFHVFRSKKKPRNYFLDNYVDLELMNNFDGNIKNQCVVSSGFFRAEAPK